MLEFTTDNHSTGATGYIGGDALYAVASTYPDLEITALVRSSDKGAKVAAKYPKVRLVYGAHRGSFQS
jgi:N-acetyl-gamma-glutamylphosphate reductase